MIMKRTIALILCVALCLTLAACGGSPAASKGDHDRLLQMLDEGNYTGAVDYINRLAREEAEQNKPDASEHPLLALLFGTWTEYGYSSSETPDSDMVFAEDGTCTVDGKSYLWQVNTDAGYNDFYVYVLVLDGASKVFNFDLRKNKDTGIITASVYRYNEEGGSSSVGNFFNEAHYEKIEMTADNVMDYFEQIDYVNYRTNEFDEVTGITLGSRLALKKDYYARYFSTITDVAVEISFLSGTQYGTFDLAAKTYSLDGEYKLSNKGERYSRTESFGNYSPVNGDNYYGLSWSADGYTSTSGSDAGKQYFSSYRTDHRIERAKGVLYLLKTEE